MFNKLSFSLSILIVCMAIPLQAVEDPNRFNRLFVPEAANPPLEQDGIHDPSGGGIGTLQQPSAAFEKLDKSKSDNHVNWVKALETKKISPRFDLDDASLEPMPLDLNIVREVKGSMPNVIYPHKQHTVWLDCSNCHPAIFVAQKGANRITMAEIIMGKKCGVCHGRVAFGVTECLRCHSGTVKSDAEGVELNTDSNK